MLHRRATPEVGQDGVLIRMRAARVDPSVWHCMTGEPRIARLVLGPRKPRERVRGWDVAGIVEAVGPQVTEFRPGDEVFVTELGADHVIDYTSEALTGRYDLILDMAGNRPLPLLRALLTETGTLVLGGGEDGGRWFGGLGRSATAQLLSPFVRQRLRALLSLPKPESLRALTELATAGALAPRVTRTFALADAATAIDHLASGHSRGKSVIVVS